jgi:hypothetical protein
MMRVLLPSRRNVKRSIGAQVAEVVAGDADERGRSL